MVRWSSWRVRGSCGQVVWKEEGKEEWREEWREEGKEEGREGGREGIPSQFEQLLSELITWPYLNQTPRD